METTYTTEQVLRKLDYLCRHDINFLKMFRANPEKLWTNLSNLAAAISRVDEDKSLEDAFADRQERILEECWIAQEYPMEYLGSKHKEFWKALNDKEREACAELLSMKKDWKTSKNGRAKHTNNFCLMFYKEAAYRSYSLDKKDFDKLGVSRNILAKIYAYMRFKTIVTHLYTRVLNGSYGENQAEVMKELYPVLEKTEEKVTYSDEVWKSVCDIFDRLVLESGYNPIILAG